MSPSRPHFIAPLIRSKALVAILVLSAILRLFKLARLLQWSLDEEFWAYIPHNIVTGYHFSLIGGHIGGTGLYSGPLFVWIISPLFWYFHSHPLGIALACSLLGVATTYLIYLFCQKTINHSTGLLAALLYATSTLAILYDRKYWNATPIAFLSILTLTISHYFIKRPSVKLALSLAFIASLSFHAHMTGFVLVAFLVIYLIRSQLPHKWFFLTTAMFLLFQTPLLVFELRHDFTNTHALVHLISPNSSASRTSHLSSAFTLPLTTNARFLYTPAQDVHLELTHCTQLASSRSLPHFSFFVLTAVIWTSFIFTASRHRSLAYLIFTNLALLFLYAAVAPENSFYSGQSAEYFLLPLFPVFAILTALFLRRLLHSFNLLALSLTLFLVIINTSTTLHLTHSQNFHLKDSLVRNAITQLAGRPFSLDVTGQTCSIYGFRYLFSLYHTEPVSSYLDSNFLWLYQHRLPSTSPLIHLTIDVDSGTIKLQDVN